MIETDPNLSKQVQNLYRLSILARWFFVVFSWLTLGTFGIWGLRHEIALWSQYFTWTALRYGIAYNRVASFCVAFCIGITTAVLIRQTINILRGGLSRREKHALEQKVLKIRARGPLDPLWKWVIQNKINN